VALGERLEQRADGTLGPPVFVQRVGHGYLRFQYREAENRGLGVGIRRNHTAR